MSTGVYRQYATQRLTAPLVTAGQPLGSPIGIAALSRPYDQPEWSTRLIPLGIAALIPVVAAFVPRPVLAHVPRASYPVQAVVEYLPTYQPSDQAPALITLIQARAPSSSIQITVPGLAALLPPAATYVPPAVVMLPTRSTAPTQEPSTAVAPFLSPNTTDTVITARLATYVRDRDTQPQRQERGIAPLLQVAATYVPPSLVSVAVRSAYTWQPSDHGIAALLPVVSSYVPPSSLARSSVITAASAQVQNARALPTTAALVPMQPLQRPHRSEYPIQRLRVVYTEPGIPPVIPDFIDSDRLLHVTFNGRTLTIDELGNALHTSARNDRVDVDGPDSTLEVDPLNRTVH